MGGKNRGEGRGGSRTIEREIRNAHVAVVPAVVIGRVVGPASGAGAATSSHRTSSVHVHAVKRVAHVVHAHRVVDGGARRRAVALRLIEHRHDVHRRPGAGAPRGRSRVRLGPAEGRLGHGAESSSHGHLLLLLLLLIHLLLLLLLLVHVHGVGGWCLGALLLLHEHGASHGASHGLSHGSIAIGAVHAGGGGRRCGEHAKNVFGRLFVLVGAELRRGGRVERVFLAKSSLIAKVSKVARRGDRRRRGRGRLAEVHEVHQIRGRGGGLAPLGTLGTLGALRTDDRIGTCTRRADRRGGRATLVIAKVQEVHCWRRVVVASAGGRSGSRAGVGRSFSPPSARPSCLSCSIFHLIGGGCLLLLLLLLSLCPRPEPRRCGSGNDKQLVLVLVSNKPLQLPRRRTFSGLRVVGGDVRFVVRVGQGVPDLLHDLHLLWLPSVQSHRTNER